MGIVVGFAAGAKLNGAILILPCLIVVLMFVYKTRPSRRPWIVRAVSGASVVIVSAYLAFLAPNPYLWRNPIHGPAKMVETRVTTIATQFDNHPDLRIPSGWPHAKHAIKRIYSTFSPFNVAPFQGWYAPPAAFDPPFIVVNLTLTMIGFLYCARQIRGYLTASGGYSSSAVAIVLVGTCASLPVAAVNLDQYRYFVIPIFFSTILLSIAIDRIATSTGARRMKSEPGP
jgi:hypothetical protein